MKKTHYKKADRQRSRRVERREKEKKSYFTKSKKTFCEERQNGEAKNKIGRRQEQSQ